MQTIKVLIIEDEIPAANRLISMVKSHRPSWTIVQVIDSISEAVKFIDSKESIDLIFMDIQLADGHSFDIFQKTNVTCPVIFATAYNEFALKAFEVNGFDYLLKPLTEEALTRSIQKFEKYTNQIDYDYSTIKSMITHKESTVYKSRFLVKLGEQLKFVTVKDIAYFYHDNGYTEIITHQNDKLLIEESIDSISKKLDPNIFFQINRKCIIHIESIKTIHQYFNSRLKLQLSPSLTTETIVSRDRVKKFKAFLSQ